MHLDAGRVERVQAPLEADDELDKAELVAALDLLHVLCRGEKYGPQIRFKAELVMALDLLHILRFREWVGEACAARYSREKQRPTLPCP